ncbi:thioredoxin family protein [Myxococcota bacterium]|nr:thioredoxin family protein [Myxococcota bacterium]MBU1381895.1 thioredoxin family protein [Myxococcota bacterium]MBU1497796.1 thioredoxin family protein [Myxococcota bacterium]
MHIVLFIIAGLFVFFIGIQLLTVMKIKKQKGKPAPNIDGKAGKIIENGGTALFYFHSPRCSACKKMTPFMRELEKKHQNIFTYDLTSDLAAARAFGVLATPTSIIVSKNTIQEILLGPYAESTIIETFDKFKV